MKKIFVLMMALAMLSGCGAATGLDQLASCGECLNGLQELTNLQGAAKVLEGQKAISTAATQ